MKVAVALSGGGARCAAQLGYIEVLQSKFSLHIESLSGSSAGAIVAAFLAKGLQPAAIMDTLLSFPYHKIKFNFFRGTLWTLEPVLEELENLGLRSFDELQKTLYITLTPYDNCKPAYKTSGNLARSVLASSALLPLFAPITIDGQKYIDGGFCDNLPITPLKKHRLFTIAINVNPTQNIKFPFSFFGNFKRAGFLLLNSNIRSSIPLADKYIEILECQNFGILERKKLETIYDAGKAQAYKDLEEWEKIFMKNS
ncbi:patatin-like phospholipase family protein [Nitratiruptor sp. YY09-18]|uniref:patatin-like phospholipase family protein n=1 Tax=Nitratiruptor sp. YY09-18 TaxID=2724901 RepID=UPI00191675A5|nr:patatin-like phospholipase family protein [Nitratiruptor sp. YY09-18]BCD67333.1 NTE family protein [Nitratiruptor sp. YY09-18]